MEQDKFYVLSANQSRKYKYLKKLIRGKPEIKKSVTYVGIMWNMMMRLIKI